MAVRPDQHVLSTPAEQGFSLVELVVVTALALVVTFATISIYSVALRSEGFTSKRAAAVLDARTALNRMTEELRQALPGTVSVPNAGEVTFKTFVPGTFASTAVGSAQPERFVRYRCLGSTCQRIVWTSGTAPASGPPVLSGVADPNVFSLVAGRHVNIALQVDIPEQGSDVRLVDSVALRGS